jgi:ABC-type branched-subunit amino acid transport system permease subunit
VRNRSRVGLLVQAVVLILLFLLPSVVDLSAYELHIIDLILITIPLAIGLLISMGHCGQINLAQVALYGVGAYTVGILISRAGVDPWPALVIGTLAGGLVGIIVGLPSLRIRGHYLAIATLGLAVAAETIFTAGGELTGGPLGIGRIPVLPGIDTSAGRDAGYYPLLLGVAAIAWIFTRMLVAGPMGAAFGAIRDDHLAAKGMGVDVGTFQLLAFTISGLLAGLAGSLYATWSGYISPDSFRPSQMFFLLTILVVGGMRSLPGVVVATTALIMVRELFQQFEAYQLIVYGSLVVIVMLVAPDGLAGLGNQVKRVIARALAARTPGTTVPVIPALPTDQEGR